MSYGLRGRDGRVYGLGSCNPLDVQCVMQEGAASVAAQQATLLAQIDANNQQCIANANLSAEPFRTQLLAECASRYQAAKAGMQTPTQAAQDYSANFVASQSPQIVQQFKAVGVTPAVAPPPPPVRTPAMAFTTSQGGRSLTVGDSWVVKITGASPNAPVTVSGTNPGGPFAGYAVGSTDANGNFSKSGTVGNGEIGSWQESWSVGGVPVGSISFTVAGSGGTTTKIPATTTGGDKTPIVHTLPLRVDGPLTECSGLGCVPWWGWLAGAGVAYLALKGK
jgi:hypothetical protein